MDQTTKENAGDQRRCEGRTAALQVDHQRMRGGLVGRALRLPWLLAFNAVAAGLHTACGINVYLATGSLRRAPRRAPWFQHERSQWRLGGVTHADHRLQVGCAVLSVSFRDWPEGKPWRPQHFG